MSMCESILTIALVCTVKYLHYCDYYYTLGNDSQSTPKLIAYNMLILSKNTDIAKQVLASYENLVLEHEGTQTLDNGVCQMMYGAIALSEGNAKEAELHLLSAENIISEVMGTNNDYAKTVYLYLNNLYSRWQKPEQALAYKNKYLECSHQR